MQCVKLSVTVGARLRHKYGAKLKQIEAARKAWIEANDKNDICTVHVEVDSSRAMKKYGMAPVKLVDGKAAPPDIKRAIDALWKRLKPDYLVLFGGCDIVPMFKVDNPFDDSPGDDHRLASHSDLFELQEKVPTDNPYASSLPFHASDRKSYLVPDRVIGRIPDRVGDANPAWLCRYLNTAKNWEPQPVSRYREAYAICSYQSRRAADKCMKYIARPDSKLLVSPRIKDNWTSAHHRLSARLHVIKCHGSPGTPKVYGEKSDYLPDALKTDTLRTYLKPATVVGTTCCYGAQIFSPAQAVDAKSKAVAIAEHVKPTQGGWPLASTYLRDGALGFVGPTVTAYAGDSEMMYADWIVAGYLNSILGGASIGRAFLETKQDYSRWTLQQGQAHGLMESMTLIEYVLLGDPSITPVTYQLKELGGEIILDAEERRQRRVALLAEERRQRRVVRVQMAREIRKLLPEPLRVTPTQRARAQKLFTKAQATPTMKEDIKRFKRFAIKPTAVRVERLHTTFRGPAAQNAAITCRESVEYYWSGQRVSSDGQKRICLLKAETDANGKLWRTEVIRSS
jgi:hypothetical protein